MSDAAEASQTVKAQLRLRELIVSGELRHQIDGME